MTAAKATRIQILEQLFATFRTHDQPAAERLLADNFTFTSPYDDAIDKAAYFAHCWPNAGLLKAQTLEHMALEGDWAYVTYAALTHEGMTLRNTELFQFAGEQIVSIEVFFGAAYHHGAFVRMR